MSRFMNRFTNKAWLLVACAAFSSAISASATELTLAQALREALDRNSGYNATRSDVRLASATRDSAWGGYLPMVTSNADYAKSWLNTYEAARMGANGNPPQPALSEAGLPSSERTAGINADWTLFSGFSTPLTQKRLRLLFEQAKDNEQLAREDLVSSVVLAYADLARQNRIYYALDTSAQISLERMRIVEQNLAVGAASHSDWLSEKVDLNADLAALQQQKATLQAARAVLGQVLGRNAPVTEDVDSVVVSDASIDLDALLQGLPEHRPDLKLAQSTTDLAKVGAEQRATSWLPRLDAIAGYNFDKTYSGADPDFYQPPVARTLGPNVGLQLNFNIFTGDFPWAAYHRAKIALTSAELRQKEAYTEAVAEVREDHASYQAADSSLVLEREAEGYSLENLGLTFLRWKSGSISYLDARTAQVQFLTTFTSTENTAFNALSERLELLLSAGQLESLVDSTVTPTH